MTRRRRTAAILGVSALALAAPGCAEMAAASAGIAAANLAIGATLAAADAVGRATAVSPPTPEEKTARAKEVLGRLAAGQTTLEQLSDSDKRLMAEMAAVVNAKKNKDD